MKQIKEVENTSLFDNIDQETPLADKLFIATSLDIAHQIILIMEQKNMLQKDLAARLGKTEAEISKWLSGFHNFTIKTISKIQSILGEKIITTPKEVTEDYSNALDRIFISLKEQKPSSIYFPEKVLEQVLYTTNTRTTKVIPLPSNFETMRFTYPENSLTGTYS